MLQLDLFVCNFYMIEVIRFRMDNNICCCLKVVIMYDIQNLVKEKVYLVYVDYLKELKCD